MGYVSATAAIAATDELICPSESTNMMAVRVVVKFLNDHPERLQERENQLVFEALRKAYPCKK